MNVSTREHARRPPAHWETRKGGKSNRKLFFSFPQHDYQIREHLQEGVKLGVILQDGRIRGQITTNKSDTEFSRLFPLPLPNRSSQDRSEFRYSLTVQTHGIGCQITSCSTSCHREKGKIAQECAEAGDSSNHFEQFGTEEYALYRPG